MDPPKRLPRLFACLLAALPFLPQLPFLYPFGEIFVTCIGTCLIWAAQTRHTGRLRVRIEWGDIFVFSYLAYGCLNALFLPEMPNAAWMCKWIGAGTVYLYVRKAEEARLMFLGAAVCAGTIQAAVGILQSLHVLDGDHLWFDVTGTFPNPGPYGGYLAIAATVAAGLSVSVRNRKSIVPLAIALAGMGYALYLSDSRAAWLAFLVPLSRKIVQAVRKTRFRIYAFIVFILLSGPCLWALYRYRPESADGRLAIWKVCTTAFIQKPLTGHGTGTFPSFYMTWQEDYLRIHPESASVLPAGNNVFAFNEFLHLACEQGIAGSVLLALVLGTAFSSPVRGDPAGEAARSGLLSGIVFACFSYPAGQFPLLIFFPLFLGMLPGRAVIGGQPGSGAKIRKAFTCAIWVGGSVFAAIRWQEYRTAGRLTAEYDLTGDAAAAAELFRRFPGFETVPELSGSFGKALIRRKEYDRAIPVLERTFQRFASPEILLDMGMCFQHEKRYAQAETCFLRADRMTPLRLLPRYRLFELYRTTNRYKEAQRLAEELVRAEVKTPNSVSLRIKAEAKAYLSRF